MAVQALYRKWRPQSFDEVVGQEHVVRTLRNALISGRIHHAYLFAGPRGTGKTTTARLLAKAVNCLAPEEEQRPCNECTICRAINEGRLLDLIEIDAASNTGVDDVRDLRERVGFRPNEARYKVYVIDEVHMLSNAAFNALLKTLEEPPEHAIFVLATTEPHKIPATVVSRCQRFEFRRIPSGRIIERLEWMAQRENIQIERQALTLIARHATGSMRDAESLLDQLASYNDGRITVEEMQAALGTGTDETIVEIADALAYGDVSRGLSAINSAVDKGTAPRQLARQIVEHLRTLLLLRLESGILPPYVLDEQRPKLEERASNFSRGALTQAVRLFNQAASEAQRGWQPQLPLEMAFIEAILSSEPEPSKRQALTTSAPARVEPKARVEAARPEVEPKSTARREKVRETEPVYSETSSLEGSLTLDVLRRNWSNVMDALRPRDLSLEALLRSCQPMAIEDDVIVLGFSHQFHRRKVEEDQKRRIVEDVLSELFGQRCRVRCVMRQSEADDSPGEPSEGDMQVSEAAGEKRYASTDPVVRTAVDELGARVVKY